MPRLTIIVVFGLALSAASALAGDWPQSRGPSRDCHAADGPALAESWPEAGLTRLWQSEPIPSAERGGLGSAVVADGKVYLFASLQKDEALATRTLSADGLKLLTWPPAGMPAHLAKAAEEARLSSEREKLSGEELEKWIDHWIAQTLDENDILPWSQICRQRLAQGKAAIDAPLLAKLAGIRDKPFASAEELDKWLAENNIAGLTRDAILRVIPKRRTLVNDTVYCLDAADGKTLWTKQFPGRPNIYGSSSTPCIAGGRCYVVGSGESAYCLDVRDGQVVWQAQCAKGQISSSFLVLGKRAFVQTPELKALDADTGATLWTQPKVASLSSSPAAWIKDGKTYLLCHTDTELACVDSADGALKWQAPAGGASSATVAGDVAVVMSENKQVGLAAYRLAADKAEKLWNFPDLLNAASPLIVAAGDAAGQQVYAATAGEMACIELAAGKLLWRQKMGGASISSPVLADGKIYRSAGNGVLLMIRPSADKYTLLGRSTMGIARCVTPAIADGRVYVRQANAVACYDLTGKP